MSAPTVPCARSVNPSTGELIATYPFVDDGEVADLLARSVTGYGFWRSSTLPERCGALERVAALLERDCDALAALATREMGKPIVQARTEVTKTAAALRWYAQHGPAMLAEEPTSVGPGTVVRYEPLGPVLSVQPWNFPIWQPMRAAMAILLAGNSYILKPAPNVVGCALALERLWDEAGLPTGVFTVLNAEPAQVALAVADPAVAAVTVTGSVGAGAAVASLAGKHVKKSVLELGGSDPFIVLADADLDAAVDAAVTGRFQNNGQVCIAAKRIIVDRSVAEEFTERFVAKVAALHVGDPADASTDVGPLARPDIREEVAAQVRRSLSQGATLLAGGCALDRPGNFYQPTVLAGARPGMAAYTEEIFGPVAALSTAPDVDGAVRLANDSTFGLSASIWTGDMDRAREIARQLVVGGVFINKISVSDPRAPIGGVKKSGYGRELSHFGVHEFTNIKTVWSDDYLPVHDRP
ncbi:aldehyde dehydrogenase family protein [Mycobacterium palustre]|uniref:Succinate dehydrogenase n=1 Tax=Mycobacterium palustre TaxID=153971 RepID=A0A1X1Z632_9MYCO|nr:aldehyde dehydrogenase family protein [Mycobacterium palustre]MCV7103532.1 aldehyde dehydrogenase family protein [Mycobacterium palustre]ORW18764.1 succinate dehydrogenase [Mycobacterium palustre]